jgi:hypothetical protein
MYQETVMVRRQDSTAKRSENLPPKMAEAGEIDKGRS